MSSSTSRFSPGPIIALLAQSLAPARNGSYTPASYVKWLEMAGARVTLVDYSTPDAEVDAIFQKTNGALFIGGGSDVPASARRFYRNMVAAHASGDTYPIWGTCDGFEWLMQIGAADDKVLTSGFDSENMSLPLNFTGAAQKGSRLLAEAKAMPVQGSGGRLTIFDALATQPLTLNNHGDGVTPADFESNVHLPQSFTVLATNRDRKGREFVSLVEGKGGLPVWAAQFHPEKNVFEQSRALPSKVDPGVPPEGGWWPFESIAHSRAAVAVSQYMANFFVDQCRASTHRFPNAAEEWRALVYQRSTVTWMAPAFAQSYIF